MGKENMALCNASNRPVVILAKKAADVKVADLQGEWKITDVNGEAVPTGMEKQPFIAFDVKEQRVHGNAGCNLINGGFKTEEGNALSISFPGMASTMMACPDMETEGKINGTRFGIHINRTDNTITATISVHFSSSGIKAYKRKLLTLTRHDSRTVYFNNIPFTVHRRQREGLF